MNLGMVTGAERVTCGTNRRRTVGLGKLWLQWWMEELHHVGGRASVAELATSESP